MSSGVRTLLKVLVAIISYGVFLALAFYAINQILNGNDTAFTFIALIILTIFGFRATKSLPFFYATRGGTGSIPITLFLIFLRIVISVFAGVLVAPWVIAKKLVSLVPGEKAEE